MHIRHGADGRHARNSRVIVESAIPEDRRRSGGDGQGERRDAFHGCTGWSGVVQGVSGGLCTRTEEAPTDEGPTRSTTRRICSGRDLG